MVQSYLAQALLWLRWLALAVTAYLSLHHWMRAGYWSFSGPWQFGLVALDPRVPAALIWWLLEAVFLVLVLEPVAAWLAQRIPDGRGPRLLASAVLAMGLGTRGVVGPLLVRACVAFPGVLHWPDQSPAPGWLAQPYTARWLVALADSWWLLPGLVLALRLLAPSGSLEPRRRRAFRALLALYPLLQPLGPAYLLTAGGPRGATMDFHLLLLQEGWGRQEFGYASALTLLLCAASAVLLWPLRGLLSAETAPGTPSRRTGPFVLWLALGVLMLAPALIAAGQPGAGWPTLLSGLPAAATSMLVCLVGAALTTYASLAWAARLSRSQETGGLGLWDAALFFPGLVLVVPLIRPWGYAQGNSDLLLLLLVTGAAPFLGLAVVISTLLLIQGTAQRRVALTLLALVGWATWTDLTLPVLLSQSAQRFSHLQGWIAWEISTRLHPSALEVPGWPLAWFGGFLLAWLTAHLLLAERGERPLSDAPVLPQS